MEALSSIILLLYWSLLMEWQSVVEGMLHNLLSLTLLVYLCLWTMVFTSVFIPLKSQRIDAFELWCWRRTLESPLESKEIQPVNLTGNQPWILIGRADAEAELPILWPPDAKTWLTGKIHAGKNWGQEEKGATEDEMVGWLHWEKGHEFEDTQGDTEGHRSLAWCSSWGAKGSDMT